MPNNSVEVHKYKVQPQHQNLKYLQKKMPRRIKMLFFSILLTMYLNCIILKTGGPDRMAIDPDLLGEGVEIVKGSIGIDKIFNFLAQ
jgi:hypothetical protein